MIIFEMDNVKLYNYDSFINNLISNGFEKVDELLDDCQQVWVKVKV
jgi:hypothetical protein